MITNLHRKHTYLVRILILLCILLSITFFTVFLYIHDSQNKFAGKIYPAVYIDGLSVGKMTKNQVFKLFAEREAKIAKSKLYVYYHDNPIATFSAQKLRLHTNVAETFEKAYLVGRTPHYPSLVYQRITTLFNLKSYTFQTQVQYDDSPVKETIALLEDSYNRPAKNALFKFENNRVVEFQKEEPGNRLLTAQYLNDIHDSIDLLKYNQKNYTVSVKEELIKPEITLAESNEHGIEELIGEGVSNYTHSIPGRIHNVILGASKFNGVLIPKNKIISFNETIGDISARTGYQPAYIIKEGKTVLGDGGGVCQISTTLFRAALNSGLPILERHAHAYRVSYYENDSKPGLDATVFAPGVDLKIKNDTDASILIQTIVDEEKMLLYFKLYGKKDNRVVELSTPTLYDVAAPPAPLYQDDQTLKKGVVKQVDFPAWGGKASFNYKVTKNYEVTFEKQFFSSYKPWQAVFLVGTQD